MSLHDSTKSKLLELYSPTGPERGGIILADGALVEFENVADDPAEGFCPRITDPLQLNEATGTWHTHPGANSNLSVGDSETFVSWPELLHAIVGSDGVRTYRVKNGAVINAA